jgi:hypothetical protein
MFAPGLLRLHDIVANSLVLAILCKGSPVKSPVLFLLFEKGKSYDTSGVLRHLICATKKFNFRASVCFDRRPTYSDLTRNTFNNSPLLQLDLHPPLGHVVSGWGLTRPTGCANKIGRPAGESRKVRIPRKPNASTCERCNN